MRPEEKIEKAFVKEATKLGFKSIKLEVNGDKGWMDQLIFLGFGKVCLIEFKAPGGVLSQHQIEKIKMMKERFEMQVKVCTNVADAIKFCEGVLYAES